MVKELTDMTLAAGTVVLAISTIVLAWATYRLFKSTEALSKRDEQQKRRTDIFSALEAAMIVQRIIPHTFYLGLSTQSNYPKEEVRALEVLNSMRNLIEEPDCELNILHICNSLDAGRREKSLSALNSDQLESKIKSIQERIQWAVNRWREELRS